VRLLTLLRLLGEGSRPTVYTLAARFHVRRESIYRDLKALQEIGYPIVGDAHGQLSRPRLAVSVHPSTPPVFLTQRELAALAWAARHTPTRQPFRGALDSALGKLKHYTPVMAEDEGAAFTATVGGWVRGTKDYSGVETTLLQLIEAILRHRRCDVRYHAPHADAPKRFQYDPYRILLVQEGVYCVGKAPAFGDIITLAIERIHSLTLTDESFTVDPKFDAKKQETEAFGVIWEKPIQVVVRFRADQAPYAREREWHPTQRLKDLADGRLELSFRAGGAFEIIRWILGWGDAAEVVRPARLREEVAKVLRASAAVYAEPSSTIPVVRKENEGHRKE
jgi:predicted DNA-binding transcriptional regulator YafY